jgi:hypothetical protein
MINIKGIKMTEQENNEVALSCNDREIKLGSTVTFFKLYPKVDEDWEIALFKNSEFVLVDSNEAFKVNYNSALLQEFKGKLTAENLLELELQQSATFVIDIQDKNEYEWRFWGDGISLSKVENISEFSFQTQIKNQGKTLIIKVDNVRDILTDDFFDFRFVAARLNKDSGGKLNEIYYSQDPRIGVRRTRG